MIRSVKFWAGVSIIAFLMIASIVHAVFFHSHIRQMYFMTDAHGNLLGAAPFLPSWQFWMGTDQFGYNTFDKVLQGAKYTLLAVMLIGTLRVAFGIIIALPMAFYVRKSVREGIEKLLSSFYYVPLTIIAIFILQPIIMEQFTGPPKLEEYFAYSYTMRIILEIVILTVLVLPVVGSSIANIIALLLREEYITGSKVLGAGNWRIFRKHIMPHLFPRLVIIFTQQCVQTLVILMHLGYFKLFFGGTVACHTQICDPPKSITNEWSGIIGNYYNFISAKPALILGPIIMFGIVIYAFQLISEGLQQHLEHKMEAGGSKKKLRIKPSRPTVQSEVSFTFVSNQKGA